MVFFQFGENEHNQKKYLATGGYALREDPHSR